jgi:hypothetical protein
MKDIPVAFRWTKDCKVCQAIAVIITGDGHISLLSPVRIDDAVRRTADDVPIALARAKDRDVRLAVAIVISGHGHIIQALTSPVKLNARSARRIIEIPVAG